MKWISISEQMPPRGIRVIIAVKGFRKSSLAWYHGGVWHQPDTVMIIQNEVTHWMHFPKPPDKEEK